MIGIFKTLTAQERRHLYWLLALAALYRALYLYLYSQQSIWSELVVDSLFHANWADQIAGGDFVGSETFFRSPLYIYVLAGLRALAPDSLLLPRIYGACLGLVSVTLTYSLARICITGKRKELAALSAGAIQALYPTVLFFEAELLVDFQFVVLLQGSLYTFLQIGSESAKKLKLYLITGLLLALAALTRATGLALIPLFIWYIWRDNREYRASVRPLRYIAAFLIGLTLIIAPVSLRNYLVSGDFSLIASSGGVNLYIGNHPEANPVSAALPQPLGSTWTIADMRGSAEQFEGHSLTDSEVSESWRNRALGWMIEHPLDFAQHYCHKLYLLLANQPYSNNRPLGDVFADNPILNSTLLNFTILLLLASLGLFAHKVHSKPSETDQARAPDKLYRLLSFAGAYALVVALFFVNERFRLPCLALLFPIGGLGLSSTVSAIKARIQKSEDKSVSALFSVKSISIVALALIVSLAPLGRPVERSQARTLYLRANHELRSGNLEEARDLFRSTLALDASYPQAHVNLGVVFFRTGFADSARAHFRGELSVRPGQADALTNLASLELSAKNYGAAYRLSDSAYRARPYDLVTVRVHLRSLAAVGDTLAIAKFELDSHHRFNSDLRYWYEVGAAWLRVEDFQAAQKALSVGAEIDPHKRTGIEASDFGYSNSTGREAELIHTSALIHHHLSFLAGISGDIAEVIRRSQQAIDIDSGFIPPYVNLGLALYNMGQLDSAKVVYERARALAETTNQSSADLLHLKAALEIEP